MVTPVTVEFGGDEFSFFSVVAQLSNVQDVIVTAHRGEHMFLADDKILKFYTEPATRL